MQLVTEETLKVYRKFFPVLLIGLRKIKDPRQSIKAKYKLTLLMIYGILMFVYQVSSLRDANKELSSAILFRNLNAMFLEFGTLPHAVTLKRLLE